MTALPPGWGPREAGRAYHAVVGHVAGLLLGALATAAVLHGIGALLWRPPLWTVGVLAALLAPVAVRLVPVELDGSPWRVPEGWGLWGYRRFAAAFGVALGTGVATKLSSAALYVVFAWALAAPTWALAWPPLVAFAVGRGLAFWFVVREVLVSNIDHYAPLDRVARNVTRLAAPEGALLTALAVLVLTATALN